MSREQGQLYVGAGNWGQDHPDIGQATHFLKIYLIRRYRHWYLILVRDVQNNCFYILVWFWQNSYSVRNKFGSVRKKTWFSSDTSYLQWM